MSSFSFLPSSACSALSNDAKARQKSWRLHFSFTKPHAFIPSFDPFPIMLIDLAHSLAEGIDKTPASTRSPQMRSAVRLPMFLNNVVVESGWRDVNLRNTFVTVGSSALLKISFHYESKFILDSFIFCVSPARFLRRLAANVDFSTRSRVYSCDLISQIKFLKWLAIIDFFTWSHDFSVLCHGNHLLFD